MKQPTERNDDGCYYQEGRIDSKEGGEQASTIVRRIGSNLWTFAWDLDRKKTVLRRGRQAEGNEPGGAIG